METKEFKYYIHVQRESRDDDYTMHETFEQEMSRDDIINFLSENEYPFDENHNRLTYYLV